MSASLASSRQTTQSAPCSNQLSVFVFYAFALPPQPSTFCRSASGEQKRFKSFASTGGCKERSIFPCDDYCAVPLAVLHQATDRLQRYLGGGLAVCAACAKQPLCLCLSFVFGVEYCIRFRRRISVTLASCTCTARAARGGLPARCVPT